MGNIWYDSYRRQLEGIERVLTEAIYRNEHEELPLQQIIQLFKGAVIEINKLEATIKDLKNKVSDLEKKWPEEPQEKNEVKK
jgi:hypothetical protein